MRQVVALVAVASLVMTQWARADDAESPTASRLVERTVEVGLKGYEKLTMFLLLPEGDKVAGVMCLCMLGSGSDAIRAKLLDQSNHNPALEFAASRNLAVVAWRAQQQWDPSRNWDELPRAKRKQFDENFDTIAKAWEKGIKYFVANHGIPESGYLMMGSSAAAQYAQRLALRCPRHFLAVHVHIASSFDAPVKKASTLLWCVTTGENELGYERSLKFFKVARDKPMSYPIVYKAFPGLGHEGNAMVTALGFACFDYALGEYARVTSKNKGRPTMPNWAEIFESAPYVADVFNQGVHLKEDAMCVPPEFRMPLPKPLREAWVAE